MSDAQTSWNDLSEPWQRAFDEAWLSYRNGDLGIGAALFDPVADVVVTAGRNRVNSRDHSPRSLSGNFMAHAEMNAIAGLDRFKAGGLDLYTTLQPCLMCSATAVFMHVDNVFFASADEYFVGLDELWEQHPYSARNKPTEVGPLRSPLATFARLLPLFVEFQALPDSPVLKLADRDIPDIAALVRMPSVAEALESVSNDGDSAESAIKALWPLLDDSAR